MATPGMVFVLGGNIARCVSGRIGDLPFDAAQSSGPHYWVLRIFGVALSLGGRACKYVLVGR